MRINHTSTNISNIQRSYLSKNDNIQNCANISFSASSDIVVKNTKNILKINKLVNNFTKIFMDDLPGLSDSKVTLSEKIFMKIFGGIAKTAIKCQALSPNGVAGILKIGNKIAGGYAIAIDKKNDVGFMMLLLLDKKYHHTRTGNKALITMAESIYKNIKANNVSKIAWNLDEDNKRAANLFSRFITHTEEYKCADVNVINTNLFGETIRRYKSLDTKI